MVGLRIHVLRKRDAVLGVIRHTGDVVGRGEETVGHPLRCRPSESRLQVTGKVHTCFPSLGDDILFPVCGRFQEGDEGLRKGRGDMKGKGEG